MLNNKLKNIELLQKIVHPEIFSSTIHHSQECKQVNLIVLTTYELIIKNIFQDQQNNNTLVYAHTGKFRFMCQYVAIH